MSTVTAIVHTKNSQHTLQQCLESLAWCEEIFVVDMESTDSTLAIAKKHHAKIFHEKQIQFADPVRNTYLQKVQTDWTLIVDSDEQVPATLAKKLQQLTATVGVNGYRVPRANMIFDKWIEHTGFWPDYIVRFFRTGSCTYPPYVHSQPVVEGVTVTLEAKPEFALIHHHYSTISQYLLRLNVYTSLEVEKIRADKELEHRRTQTEGAAQFLRSFFDEFFRRFFAQQGYKDGMHGFVISLLQAIYMLVVEMKIWELQKKDAALSLMEIESSISTACQQTMYWTANESLVSEKNVLNKIVQKVKRKLNS